MQIQTTVRCHHIQVRMAANNRTVTSAGEVGGGRSPIHFWRECKLVQPLRKTAWRFLKKLRLELPHDPAILLLSVSPKNLRTFIHKDTRTPMPTEALFMAAKTWKHPKCPSIDKDVLHIQWTTSQPQKR